MMSTPTAFDEAAALFDSYSLTRFGYEFHEYVVIREDAPVASVREGIRDYLGSEVKASNENAREILDALDGSELFEANGFTFVDPNVFIVAVATTIEI